MGVKHPGESILFDICYHGAIRQPGQRVAVALRTQEVRDLVDFLNEEKTQYEMVTDRHGRTYMNVYGVEVREVPE